MFTDPRAVHATCEDYRAAAGRDLELDQHDYAAGLRVRQPLLALRGGQELRRAHLRRCRGLAHVRDREELGRRSPTLLEDAHGAVRRKVGCRVVSRRRCDVRPGSAVDLAGT